MQVEGRPEEVEEAAEEGTNHRKPALVVVWPLFLLVNIKKPKVYSKQQTFFRLRVGVLFKILWSD